eukprot:TRINITY_DN177_c0_g1_i19.p1 TRINITY_DN177_c0_g1~~TRINITY_DN177_c0_g1_i19.p1  ORF type:complete len:106 (+),score=17.70 TRINITY_DN177_c0_g1_i19:40-318(+)
MDTLLTQPPQYLLGGLVVVLIIIYFTLGRPSSPRKGKKRVKPQAKIFQRDPKDDAAIYRSLGKDGKPLPDLLDSIYGLQTLYDCFQYILSLH